VPLDDGACARRRAARDRDALLSAMRASRSLHHPWVAPATTEQQFEALIRKATEPSFEALLACRRSDGTIVGFFLGFPDELVGPPMRAQDTVKIMTSADDTGLLGKEPTVESEPLLRAGLKVDVEPTGGAA